MNRRKLQRRTLLAEKIRLRWFVHRQLLRAFADLYKAPPRWIRLGDQGLTPADYEYEEQATI